MKRRENNTAGFLGPTKEEDSKKAKVQSMDQTSPIEKKYIYDWSCVKKTTIFSDSLQSQQGFDVECYTPTSTHEFSGNGGPMLIFCKIPGPICNLAIYFPTEVDNSKGAPHCLEHLIFLGSEDVPFRGYLDVLASRCISPGTNASTGSDFTCYTVSTAGSVGLVRLLPTFLSFILHPSLSDSNFTTEVYHVDGSGKEQGVVYCEMLGYERTERELLAFNFNQLMYPNTGYSYDTGGLTPEIAKLTNEEVRKYHQQYYRPDNMRILILGDVNIEDALKSLSSVDFSNEPSNTEKLIPWAKPLPSLNQSVSKSISFPSEDESVGSVTIGWRGPSVEDVETIVALEILFRYLQENPASPIQQRFVERPNPLASSVAYGINPFLETSLELTFGGISYKADHCCDDHQHDEEQSGTDEEDEEEDDEEDDDDEDDEDEDEEDEDDTDEQGYEPDLMKEGSIKSRLFDLLKHIKTKGFPEGKNYMKKIVQRHRVKFLEDLEDDPLDLAERLLSIDLIYPNTKNGNRSFCDGIGSRGRVLQVMNDLEKKNDKFWLELLDKWLISSPHIEIIMKPDLELANKIAKDQQDAVAARVKQLGEKGLQEKAQQLELAEKQNKTPLPDDIASTFPSVPSTDSIATLPYKIEKCLNKDNGFGVQVIKTNTNFYHCRPTFRIDTLPTELKPYLVLFQELLLATDLTLPSKRNRLENRVPYTDVVRHLSEDLVTIECGVGFSNETFACGVLSEVFYTYGVAEASKIQLLFKWIKDLLFFSTFTVDRIKATVNNLINDIAEESRQGDLVCSALATVTTFETFSNDVAISIFKQRTFLNNLKQNLKTNAKQVIAKLDLIRKYLLSEPSRIYVLIGLPINGSLSENDLIAQFSESWVQARKVCSFSKEIKTKPLADNFVFAKVLKAPSAIIEHSILTPIGGVDSSYLEQYIPCEIHRKHPDYYPIMVLNEILSCSEGPIWNEIRGKGLAYDARLDLSLWPKSISFSLSESSDPVEALKSFYSILERLPNTKSHKWLTNFSIDTARASVIFGFHNGRSTAVNVITKSLKSLLMGFDSVEEEWEFLKTLEKVTTEDLLRVYEKYYTAFLDPNRRSTLLVCNPSVSDSFLQLFAKDFKINFQVQSLTQVSENLESK